MPRPVCEEQLRLAHEVAKAVQTVYAAKRTCDQAAIESRSAAALFVALRKARKTELEAVAALDAHRKEHGC